MGAGANFKDNSNATNGTNAETSGQTGSWQRQTEEPAGRQGEEAAATGADKAETGDEGLAKGGVTVCAEAGVEVVWQGRHGQQEAANKVEATAGVDASEGIWDLAAEAKGAGRRARGQRVC